MSCLSAPHRGEVYAANRHSRKDADSSAHSANHSPCGSRLAATAEAGGSVLLLEEDSVRRPQRPGVQHAPKRAFRTPRQFTLENRREPPTLPQSPAGLSRHLTLALLSTLLEGCIARNRKLARACEETVEDWDCLWKEEEKMGGNLLSIPAFLLRGASTCVRRMACIRRVATRAMPCTPRRHWIQPLFSHRSHCLLRNLNEASIRCIALRGIPSASSSTSLASSFITTASRSSSQASRYGSYFAVRELG